MIHSFALWLILAVGLPTTSGSVDGPATDGRATEATDGAAASDTDTDTAADTDAAADTDPPGATDEPPPPPELPPQVPEPEVRTVRVVVAGRAPFVIRDGESLDGVSIGVWRALAQKTKLNFEIMEVDDVRAALEKVMTRRADVAVGPISITAWRARRVAFTQPYFRSSVAIMAPSGGDLWSRVAPFLGRALGVVGGVLLGVLLLVGLLLWLAERRRNPEHFPPDPVRGIGNGMWAALVTMTTVGYGDLVPRTPMGRLVAGVWMLVAMVSASSLTATIATVLTLEQMDQSTIAEADELDGKRVAAGRNTPAAEFAQRNGARIIHVDAVEDGADVVAAGRADALVFDRPILRHYLRQNPESTLVLSPVEYEPTGYGFAVRVGNPLAAELDVALLELEEDGSMRDIASRWLGD